MTTRQQAVAGIERTFRDLAKNQIDDPETLEALDAIGFGGNLTWADLLDNGRLLLISAAGSGKTFECQQQARTRFAAGEAAFFLTLEGVASTPIADLLTSEELGRLREWLADGQSRACFFLDSIDELQLSHGDFRLALRRLKREIDGSLDRATVVVTSRPIAIDLQAFATELPLPKTKPAPALADAGDRFRKLISGETRREDHDNKQSSKLRNAPAGVRIVGLTPLSTEQIGQLIEQQCVADAVALLAEIDRKRAWEYAKRPQELIEICSYWKDHGRLGSRAEQLAEDIRRKLGETGGRRRHVRISEARALEGAERLALAQLMTRKRSIRFSDLSLDDLEREAAIDPTIILADWPAPERDELLQRPLFGLASYGRVRFHHRSAAEFLAARFLDGLNRQGHMPRAALFRLLFGETYGQKLVFPSMRAVAAWMSIWNDAVRDELLAREPEALMDEGDPESFSTSIRERILSEYVRRYGGDGWRGVRIPYPQVLRFATPDLSPVVRRLWSTGLQSPEVRELLIDLIYAGRMVDCLAIANSVAADRTASITDRVTAISALGELTDPGSLQSLIEEILAPDGPFPSQVKAGVLDALFPKHLSVQQLVTLLAQIEARKHSVWASTGRSRDCSAPCRALPTKSRNCGAH